MVRMVAKKTRIKGVRMNFGTIFILYLAVIDSTVPMVM
jgi:hypothetical protein